jgi:Domain of unknown function (DUF4288)
MALIPPDAIWYIAELIEEIQVADSPTNIVHRNFILVRADSPDDAYEKALTLGKDAETEYENPAGKLVRLTFLGLGGLHVVHDTLEHGVELMYEESFGVAPDELQKWVRTKEQLEVLLPIGPDKPPDYSSGEVIEQAEALIKRGFNR